VGKGGAEAPAHGGAGASWSDFVAFVGRTRSALAHHLGLCTMSALEGGILTVEAPRGFYYDYLARRDHLEELEQFAGAFFGREVRANLVAQSAPESGASAVVGRKKAVAELRETALQDPAVRAAVQILGGEVQEVKARRPQGRREVE
jgi:hypothetical protein